MRLLAGTLAVLLGAVVGCTSYGQNEMKEVDVPFRDGAVVKVQGTSNRVFIYNLSVGGDRELSGLLYRCKPSTSLVLSTRVRLKNGKVKDKTLEFGETLSYRNVESVELKIFNFDTTGCLEPANSYPIKVRTEWNN